MDSPKDITSHDFNTLKTHKLKSWHWRAMTHETQGSHKGSVTPGSGASTIKWSKAQEKVTISTSVPHILDACITWGFSMFNEDETTTCKQIIISNYRFHLWNICPCYFPCFDVWVSQYSCPQVLPKPDLCGEAPELLQKLSRGGHSFCS